ncbi:MAG: hypothetical protein F9K16_08355 [Thermoanaerobaculia bacterium]|nr:MAG: hypothetical protein F9K16_08355 [Thermoanaerobaculia bacterium]MBZ0101213.1 hypothetical protein [Thermoanaerobaculia bacterium]
MAKGGSGGCLRGILIGCGVVFLLVVVGIAGIAMNFDAIRQSGWYRSIADKATSARADVESALKVRSELLAIYPATQLGANVQFSSTNGVSDKRLVLTFVDPAFTLPEGRSATEALARRIATDAARRFNRSERFNTIVVELARSSGAATTAESYAFAVADLLAPAAGTGGEPEQP